MNTISVNYLITAKEEYEKKLIKKLQNSIYNYFKSLYNDAVILCNDENTPENILMVFQHKMENMAKWKPVKVNAHYNRFIKSESCNYFSDLVKIIFITNIKILTLLGHNKEKLKINIPSAGKFLHLVYLECARHFWQLPYIFYNYKKNLQAINIIIEKSIISVI